MSGEHEAPSSSALSPARLDLRGCFAPVVDADPESADAADAILDPSLPAYFFADPGDVSEGPPTRPSASIASAPPPPFVAGAPVTPARDERSAAARTAGLPPIGAIIDKYRIEELIGMGGFAAVYRATHLLLRRPVALKLLRTDILRKRPGLAALLCEEARMAASIDHPNVVRVFDVTHTERITYVVMEFTEGRTLAALIRDRGSVSASEVVAIGRAVASGIAAAHEAGIVHRDVKPQNILLAPDGTVKLLDLGLARSTLEDDTGPSGGSAVVGTYGYMAPEQVDHPSRVDHRADIYGLGATLYHAVTGVPPFRPRPAGDRQPPSSVTEPIPSAHSIDPRVPPVLSQLLERMLARSPEGRPASVREVFDVLTSLKGEV